MMDVSVLHDLLVYDSCSGRFWWKHRPISFFKTDGMYRSWNTRYAFTEAFTSESSDGYKQGHCLGKLVKAHRVAFAMAHGFWPFEVDHLNGDRHDNRAVNLRECNSTINGQNMGLSPRNSSGTTGVSFFKRDRRWMAYIRANGKRVHLGSFATKDEAVIAREEANKIYGFHPLHGKRNAWSADKC